MADYDLEALSLSELKKMQKDIAKAISTFEDRQKAEARTKVEALARELGYSLAELVGTEARQVLGNVAPDPAGARRCPAGVGGARHGLTRNAALDVEIGAAGNDDRWCLHAAASGLVLSGLARTG